MNIRKNLFIMAIIVLAGMAASAVSKEIKVDVKMLPKAITESFAKAYPHATILGAESETEKSTKYFELKTVDGNTKRDILYTETGKLIQLEEKIKDTEIPAAVSNALKAKYPDATLKGAEKVTKDNFTSYELKFKEGKTIHEVVFDVTGKILETEK